MSTPDDPPRRVADHIVDQLATVAGVRHVFGVHGANVEDLFDAVFRSSAPVEAVVAKHEFSAAAMADAYHRTGNRLAAVMATSGGGALNLVPALGEAYASEVPVIALVGQPPTALEGRGAFQDQSGLGGAMDAQALFSPISRFCERVEDPETVGDVVARAVRAALSEPRGPAVLLLPKDVQQAKTSSPYAEPGLTPGRAAAGAVGDALAALTAEPVLIIAGGGVARADARAELAEFAAATGAWVAVEPDARDVFDNLDPRFVGSVGASGHPSVRRALDQAATCVFVGTRFPQMARGGLEDGLGGKTIVCFGRGAPYVDDGAPVLLVDGELRADLRLAADRIGGPPRPCPPHPGVEFLPHERTEGARIACREVIEEVAAVIPDDANVISDAGNTGCAVMHFLPAPSRGRCLLAMGMGGMGFSFGAAIGAALANGRRTFLLAGDGSFLMHGLEVHTAVEYDLPITFVIFNNNAHAACLSREELFYGGDSAYSRFRPSDPGAGAAMFPALRSATVATLEELHDFLAETGESRSPRLVSVEVRPEELPPYLPLLQPAHLAANR
ncbi:thiamine pyrophosphate-binding protein [Actinomadura sp. DC4]|uniref:thiamine pyrophosphate-binding protein n=1 Tax=Actinomadura sp. DC4 TaxID=3055069 RepID=UPI0025B00D52|nr:thiamine pyrophosphate-binding protein [Actinomadura sp. DC4]MDN3354257.1 thiamine pyrophosphate-binding protein [Actinomadura sp. DC4]